MFNLFANVIGINLTCKTFLKYFSNVSFIILLMLFFTYIVLQRYMKGI